MTTQKKPAIKQGWLRALAIIIPWTIFTGIFSLLAIFALGKNPFTGVVNINETQSLIVQLFGLLGTFLIVWIFTKFIDRKPFKSVGFNYKKMGLDIALGITVGFLLIAIGFYILKTMGQLQIESINLDYLKIGLGVLFCIIVALNEELIFRGYLLNNLMDSIPKYWALIIVSILFGVVHLGNPNIDLIGFSNIVLAGFFLGISYIYTKSLWFPIALHFSWNFFQGTIFGYSVSGTESYSLIRQSRIEDSIWNGGEFGFEASITSLIFVGIATVLIGIYYKKKALSNIDKHA
jgi:membrane protease YdiL (CAAX protease family)